VGHRPVLLKEAVDYLQVQKGEKYLDATLGRGGHLIEIWERGGRVLGIDFDPEAIRQTKERVEALSQKGEKGREEIIFHRGNFVQLKKMARQHDFLSVGGILFDLGVSSDQLLDPKRGFSFRSQEELDMRMDPDLKVTAADLVNGLSKGELNELFTKLGEEQLARPIARAVVRARALKPIKTGAELAKIISRAVPVKKRRSRIHPATRSFQALRIAVNDELNNLKEALPQAVDLLKPEGRLVVISFHSLEDRIVKRFFREREDLEILTPKPIRPTEEEKETNPRSRSAKMRVGEKKK
jgi:16S rRNA (cytosine1402-N4)-methyltransferase